MQSEHFLVINLTMFYDESISDTEDLFESQFHILSLLDHNLRAFTFYHVMTGILHFWFMWVYLHLSNNKVNMPDIILVSLRDSWQIALLWKTFSRNACFACVSFERSKFQICVNISRHHLVNQNNVSLGLIMLLQANPTGALPKRVPIWVVIGNHLSVSQLTA